jgi:hypothetical protein
MGIQKSTGTDSEGVPKHKTGAMLAFTRGGKVSLTGLCEGFIPTLTTIVVFPEKQRVR